MTHSAMLRIATITKISPGFNAQSIISAAAHKKRNAKPMSAIVATTLFVARNMT